MGGSMIQSLIDLLQASNRAYSEVEEAGQRALDRIVTATNDADTPPIIAAAKSLDAAFDELQRGTDKAYERFIRDARTIVIEAEAKKR